MNNVKTEVSNTIISKGYTIGRIKGDNIQLVSPLKNILIDVVDEGDSIHVLADIFIGKERVVVSQRLIINKDNKDTYIGALSFMLS